MHNAVHIRRVTPHQYSCCLHICSCWHVNVDAQQKHHHLLLSQTQPHFRCVSVQLPGLDPPTIWQLRAACGNVLPRAYTSYMPLWPSCTGHNQPQYYPNMLWRPEHQTTHYPTSLSHPCPTPPTACTCSCFRTLLVAATCTADCEQALLQLKIHHASRAAGSAQHSTAQHRTHQVLVRAGPS